MYCIGLMSGTSVDGIDACLTEISGSGLELQVRLLKGATYPYPPSLRTEILEVCDGAVLTLPEVASLDDAIASQFALAAQSIQEEMPRADLIGSHGQTVFHRPPDFTDSIHLGYSWQLGRGDAIAHITGIPTVSNFRAADIAAGGQGAPLVPKIDACLLSHPTEHRCVQNLGGIGNVTYLPPRHHPHWEEGVRGWDTGPGNVLLDLAVQKFTQGKQTYDAGGQWAAQGTPCLPLVEHWLKQAFFKQPPPKSTGRELFGEGYLTACWAEAQSYELEISDFLATLTELTALSVVENYRAFLPRLPDTILLCGGGGHNLYLRARLSTHLGSQTQLLTTDDVGLSADFKEAIAFAVLAYWRFHDNFPGNLPQVTGAKQPQCLGEIHPNR
ncbi:MAG: anhydro-N-acetylmuramic acid kinase [Microcystaceae cyanobacterium]